MISVECCFSKHITKNNSNRGKSDNWKNVFLFIATNRFASLLHRFTSDSACPANFFRKKQTNILVKNNMKLKHWCLKWNFLLGTHKFFLAFWFFYMFFTAPNSTSLLTPQKADRAADIHREKMKKKREMEQASLDATSDLLDTDSNATFAMVSGVDKKPFDWWCESKSYLSPLPHSLISSW